MRLGPLREAHDLHDVDQAQHRPAVHDPEEIQREAFDLRLAIR